jgi:Na+-transporting methylmalonyl-CoA/oxaloacetate decarboxylase gamma subunit
MPEWLSFGLSFALIGIAIVFVALSIIAIAVALIKRLDDGWQAREKRQRNEALEKDQSIDSITLVLIAAAAATMIQGRFHIRKVRRLLPLSAQKSPWSVEGRAILHGSHVVPRKR